MGITYDRSKELARLPATDANDIVVHRHESGGVRFGDDLNDKYADFVLDRAATLQLRDALTAFLGEEAATEEREG